MGENAKVRWEWHNNEVGEGYQARGVVRQSSISCTSKERIIDMTGSCDFTHSTVKNSGQQHDRKSSKKKSRLDDIGMPDVTLSQTGGQRPRLDSNGRGGKVNVSHEYRFNPLMQEFALRLNEVCTNDT